MYIVVILILILINDDATQGLSNMSTIRSPCTDGTSGKKVIRTSWTSLNAASEYTNLKVNIVNGKI